MATDDDDALMARSQLLDNITFGVSNNFPILCYWKDYTPINNTTFTSGNDIQVDIAGMKNCFFDPAYFRMACQFYLTSSNVNNNSSGIGSGGYVGTGGAYMGSYFQFDYNSKCLIDFSELYINGSKMYKLEYLNRFAMIMSDLFDTYPYVANAGSQLTYTGTGVRVSQTSTTLANSLLTPMTQNTGATSASYTVNDPYLVSTAQGNTITLASEAGNFSTAEYMLYATGSLSQSAPLYFGKQQDPHYGQMQSKRRTGIPMKCNVTNSSTWSYAISMKIPDFIIGEYAKKFIYLEAIKTISYKFHLDTIANAMVQTVSASGSVLNTTNQALSTSVSTDSTAKFNLNQVKFFGKIIEVKGGKLAELLQDAYVETSIPKVIQAANCYAHYCPTISSNSGQIATGINCEGAKSIIIVFSRPNDNTLANFYLTNNVAGFVQFQIQIGNQYFPLNKIDSSNYPLEFYEQWHGFPLGEPKYNGTNDQSFILDQIPAYQSTAQFGLSYTDNGAGSSSTANNYTIAGQSATSTTWSGGANNTLPNGAQTDTWNTQADYCYYSRVNSIFQLVIDDPNLYDHEFQESRFKINAGDMYINYTTNALCSSSSISSLLCHIFIVYGVNVVHDELGAAIKSLTAAPSFD